MIFWKRQNGVAHDLDGLLAEAGRADRLQRCAQFLPSLDPEQSRFLVNDVARRFLAYVYDLPASEGHHHSGPFELFDHSLEVAEIALRSAQSKHFVTDTMAHPEVQEYRVPRLRYSAFLFGLLHDVGKVATISVQGPDFAVWNPYHEPLLDFYIRHDKRRCTWAWKRGRGMDGHAWHGAYLIARLLTPTVAEYLGSRVLGEILGQESKAAREIEELISKADSRSTKEDLARQAEVPSQRVFVAVDDYVDRIPDIFSRAVADGIFRLNVLGGEILVGERYFILKYPVAVQKLAGLTKVAVGRESAAARSLQQSEKGARALAAQLHSRRRLFYDVGTDAWKMKVRSELDGRVDSMNAILVRRDFLPLDLPSFDGGVVVSRSSDGSRLEPEGFRVPPEPEPSIPVEKAPSGPGQRKFISPKVLLEDIRTGIFAGWIKPNVWNGPCFVLPDTTYMTSPRGFQIMVEQGLYSRDPKSEISAYLDALGKEACVRKHGSGRVLTAIQVRPGARPLWVVAFETRGLFRDDVEIARVGYWFESPIRELTKEEIRAINSSEVVHA